MIPHGMPSVLSDEYLRRVAAICADAEQMAAGLTEGQLSWTPPDGGWSVAEVLEHLLIATGFFLPTMNALVAGKPPAESPRPWTPSFFGKLILKAIDPVNRATTNAPKIFRPGPTPRPRVVAAFLDQMAEYRTVLVRGSRADWNRIRLSSPVARFIRVNLGDAYTIIVLHSERHINQVRRVIERPEFPRANGAA
jgi:hypothetical protein